MSPDENDPNAVEHVDDPDLEAALDELARGEPTVDGAHVFAEIRAMLDSKGRARSA